MEPQSRGAAEPQNNGGVRRVANTPDERYHDPRLLGHRVLLAAHPAPAGQADQARGHREVGVDATGASLGQLADLCVDDADTRQGGVTAGISVGGQDSHGGEALVRSVVGHDDGRTRVIGPNLDMEGNGARQQDVPCGRAG